MSFSARFDDVIIFIIGGATFEECATVANINARRANALSSNQTGSYGSSLPPRVMLASNCVHNTRRLSL